MVPIRRETIFEELSMFATRMGYVSKLEIDRFLMENYGFSQKTCERYRKDMVVLGRFKAICGLYRPLPQKDDEEARRDYGQ